MFYHSTTLISSVADPYPHPHPDPDPDIFGRIRTFGTGSSFGSESGSGEKSSGSATLLIPTYRCDYLFVANGAKHIF
jgi:hypothetical protein